MKILDLTAGNRAIWFNKNRRYVTYVDKRAEVNPTVVADATKLPWIGVGAGYSLIVFDPPHVNTGKNSHMSKRYGHHTTAEILTLVEGAGREAHRVSKPNALMAFKWNDHDIKLDRALKLMDTWWEPLFGQHLKNRGGADAKSQSFWVMLKRKGG